MSEGEGAGGPSRCPVCNGEVTPAEVRACPRCETPHHRECWDYVGSCAIFGCQPASGEAGDHGARLPVASQDRREVATLARWYTGLFRVHWWSFLAMALPMAWAPVVTMFAFLVRTEWIFWGNLVLMLLGAFGYFLLLVPLLGTRWALERRLGTRLATPRQGTTTLLESMDMSRAGGLLLGFVRHGPLALLAGLVFVVMVSAQAGYLFWGVFAIPLLYGVRHATRQRVLMIEALQNRLLASLKKG